MDLISKAEIEETWDRLAVGHFAEAPIRDVPLHGGVVVKALHLPREESFKPRLAWKTGLSFVAKPRLAAYRYRLVLVPLDVFLDGRRWQVSGQDIADLMCWSAHMQHVVTLSTFKSGASTPFTFHAQSFPLKRGSDGAYLSALPSATASPVIAEGRMPHFASLCIEQLARTRCAA